MIARLLPAVALLAALGPAAWGQTSTPAPAPAPAPPAASGPATPPPAAAPAQPQAATPALSKSALAAVDRRINLLHSELGITAAQQPLWDAFADSMRRNAADTEALFRQRAAAAPTMNAVANMRSYADIARAYADDLERLANDFASLYAGLTDLQRHAADTLFRKQTVAAAQPK